MKSTTLILTAALCLTHLTGSAFSGPEAARARENLESPDPEIRSDACLALVAEGESAVEDLAPLLGDSSLLVRHTAAYALARIGSPAVAELFREGLNAAGADRRRISVLGLGMLGRADRERIRPLLEDGSWEVRWSAAYVLGRSGDRRDLAVLGNLARNDPRRDPASGSYPVREAATKAIRRLNSVVGWLTDLDRARELTSRTGRPLLIYFRSGGSELCRKFEKEVFTDDKIIDTAQRMIPVWLDHAVSPADFAAFRVTRVPALVLAAPGGSRQERIDGTTRREVLLDRMLAFLETEKSGVQLRARLRQSPSDLETAWQLASIYLEGGMVEGASQLLDRIIAQDPDNLSSLLDNALFARAYLAGERGDYGSSARQIDALLARFPVFGDRAEALYCGGLAHLRAGDAARGRDLLEILRRDYPACPSSAAAATILSGLDDRAAETPPGR